jgi:hypothetical protein
VDLSTLANVATALAVFTAVAFGLAEARRARRERAERVAFAAVQAILTPEWMKSMIVVQNIPDGSTASEIEGDARIFAAVQAVGCILEGLGYSVYARICSLARSRRFAGWHCSAGVAQSAALCRRRTPAQRFAENFRVVPMACYAVGAIFTRKDQLGNWRPPGLSGLEAVAVAFAKTSQKIVWWRLT